MSKKAEIPEGFDMEIDKAEWKSLFVNAEELMKEIEDASDE